MAKWNLPPAPTSIGRCYRKHDIFFVIANLKELLFKPPGIWFSVLVQLWIASGFTIMYGRQGNNNNMFSALKSTWKCRIRREVGMFIFLNHLPLLRIRKYYELEHYIIMSIMNFIRLCLWSFRHKHISGVYALQRSYTNGNGGNGPLHPPHPQWWPLEIRRMRMKL